MAAIADLGGFALLHAAGLPIAPAAALSFLAATVVNYRLSARYAFGAAPSWRGYGRFLAAACLGLCVNVGVTLLASLALPSAVLSKAIGIAVAFVANFLLNLVLVFPRG